MNKKEEFRRYLEKTGVLDALTKVLVGLYEEPERPVHAVEYIRRYLGSTANNHTGVDMEGLQRENQELKVRLEKLQKQLAVQQQQQQQQHPYSAKAKSASTTVPASQQSQQQSHPSSSATPASSTNKTSSSTNNNHTNNKKSTNSNSNSQTAASPASSQQQQQQSASKKWHYNLFITFRRQKAPSFLGTTTTITSTDVLLFYLFGYYSLE